MKTIAQTDWLVTLAEPTTYMIKGIMFIAFLVVLYAVWHDIAESVREIRKHR